MFGETSGTLASNRLGGRTFPKALAVTHRGRWRVIPRQVIDPLVHAVSRDGIEQRLWRVCVRSDYRGHMTNDARVRLPSHAQLLVFSGMGGGV